MLTLLARLLEREGGREDPRLGEFSSSATVYKTPANGENMVLTHMSNRVYTTLAYFFMVAESILAIADTMYYRSSYLMCKKRVLSCFIVSRVSAAAAQGYFSERVFVLYYKYIQALVNYYRKVLRICGGV